MFTKEKIKQLQKALKGLELYNGNIDGIVGSLTLGAIRKFESLMSDRRLVEKPKDQLDELQSSTVKLSQDTEGADIEEALIFTLKNEGGYVDIPQDRGGATNKGITINTLSRYLGRKASKKEVKNLNHKTITAIYKKYYWDVMNLDNLQDQSIATVLFDMGVLTGPGTSARIAQEVLNITQTKKFDKATLQALNATTAQEFIPKFAKRHIKRFNEIVANRPSQKIFLKGWKNRANRLLTLIHEDDIENKSPKTNQTNLIGEELYALAKEVGVPKEDIQKMIDWQKEHRPQSNPRYWVVFKIKEHSRKKRMHIFDRVEKKVQSVYATHGKKSDPNHDGLATEFSNKSGSHKSALGLYRTAETYIGKHGQSLRLDGLEESNSNARKRAIVFHGASYAQNKFVKKYGKCGRSLGCPAVGHSVVKDLIAKIKGGSLLLIS